MPDVNNSDAPNPAESAAAAGVLSGGPSSEGGRGNDLPVTPGRGATALAPAEPPTPDAQHSAVGKVFHGILGTLSGGGTEPSMDASGNITEAPVHRTGGDWARRLLAGALTGMASGAAAPIRPGGGAAAGIGAGFEGEERALGNQDAEKRQQLQQNFKNQQAKQQQDRETQTAADEGLLRKAQTALLTTQNTAAGFELARKKAEASEESINAFNTFQKLVGADPANVDLGVFPDMNAVLAYRKLHPELTAQIAGGHDSGQIAAVPSFDENGLHNGVHAVLVHPGMLDRPLAEVFPNPGYAPGFQYRVPGKMVNGKPGPDEWKTAAFAPGTKLGDALTMNQKSATDAATAKLRDVQIAHEEVETEKTRREMENPAAKETPQGKKFDEETAASAAKAMDTARGGDFRFRSMAGSYPLALKGDQQAMMNILTNHIGMTLGMQKGARITKDILREAQQSTPWLANIGAKFSKDGFLSGVTLTKEQMQQMMTLSTAQRSNAWAQAIESARQGGVADKLQIPADVRIRVKGKDGAFGTIPGSQLSQAEDQGYEVAPQ